MNNSTAKIRVAVNGYLVTFDDDSSMHDLGNTLIAKTLDEVQALLQDHLNGTPRDDANL